MQQAGEAWMQAGEASKPDWSRCFPAAVDFQFNIVTVDCDSECLDVALIRSSSFAGHLRLEGRAATPTRGVTGPPLHLTDDPPIPPVSSRRPLCRASRKMVTAVVVVMAAVVLLDVVVGVVQ